MTSRISWYGPAVGRIVGLIFMIPLLSACEKPVLAISSPASHEVRSARAILTRSAVPANATPTISYSDATNRIARVQYLITPAALRVCSQIWAHSYCRNKIGSIQVSLDWEQESVNAYADQNDQIGFYGGIMHLLQRDNEIAGVMAHEISHVLLQHNRKAAANAARGEIAGTLLGVLIAGKYGGNCTTSSCQEGQQNLVRKTGAIGQKIGAVAYSPSMELEADHLGAFILDEAGYNLGSSIIGFVRMERNRQRLGTSGRSYISYFKTHPLSDERIAHYLRTQKDIANGKTIPKLLDDN